MFEILPFQQRFRIPINNHDLSKNRLTLAYKWKNGQNMFMTSLLTTMFESHQVRFIYAVGCGQTHCLFPDRIERYSTCNYIYARYVDNYMIPYAVGECIVRAFACSTNRESFSAAVQVVQPVPVVSIRKMIVARKFVSMIKENTWNRTCATALEDQKKEQST